MMAIAIGLRLLGLVEPFVFQTIIDRVLPFQREATLILIVYSTRANDALLRCTNRCERVLDTRSFSAIRLMLSS